MIFLVRRRRMAMQRTASSSLKHAGMINKDVTTASTTQPGLFFARSPGTRVPGKAQTSPMPCHSWLPMQPRDLHTIVDGVIPVPDTLPKVVPARDLLV